MAGPSSAPESLDNSPPQLSSAAEIAAFVPNLTLKSYLVVDLGQQGPVEKIASSPIIPGTLWLRNFGMAPGVPTTRRLDSLHIVLLKNRQPISAPQPRKVCPKLMLSTDEQDTDEMAIQRCNRPLKPILLLADLCLMTTFTSNHLAFFDTGKLTAGEPISKPSQARICLGPYQQRADGQTPPPPPFGASCAAGEYLDPLLGEEWYMNALCIGASAVQLKGQGSEETGGASWREVVVAVAFQGFVNLVRAREEPDQGGKEILKRLRQGPAPSAEPDSPSLKKFEVRLFRIDESAVSSIELSANGYTLFIGLATGRLLVHSTGLSTFGDAYRCKLMLTRKSPAHKIIEDDSALSLMKRFEDDRLLLGWDNGKLCLVSTASTTSISQIVRSFSGHVAEPEEMDDMGWVKAVESPFAHDVKNDLFALAGADGGVRIWSLSQSEPLSAPSGPRPANVSRIPHTLRGFFPVKPRSLCFADWEPVCGSPPGESHSAPSQQAHSPVMLAVVSGGESNRILFYE